jgi:5-methylcytosine-specific restriction endonuclease McrA
MTDWKIELKRRILDLLGKDGDYCHGCRRPFQVNDWLLIGQDGRARLAIVGMCCSDRLSVDLGSAIWVAPGDTRSPEAFDETLYVEQEAVRRNAYWQGREQERAAWWAWYDEYLKTDAWRAKRRKVLQRAGGICEGCSERQAEHVHHKTYEHAGRELLFELVALCRECHDLVHGERQ